MADIELVIKISEEDYKGLQEKDKFNNMFLNYYEKLIVHGTPLPKGHGALIDISNIDVIELEDSIHFIRHEKGDDVDVYIGAPIIIEANKSEIPTGSTTKNDLGVDCISRADVNRIICEYRDDAAETGSERDLERAYGANAVGALISKLPSVTPQEPILNKLKEKDEAKAVRYEGDGYADGEIVYDMAFCPNCEHEFEEDSENWECDFCPSCGQRLRW